MSQFKDLVSSIEEEKNFIVKEIKDKNEKILEQNENILNDFKKFFKEFLELIKDEIKDSSVEYSDSDFKFYKISSLEFSIDFFVKLNLKFFDSIDLKNFNYITIRGGTFIIIDDYKISAKFSIYDCFFNGMNFYCNSDMSKFFISNKETSREVSFKDFVEEILVYNIENFSKQTFNNMRLELINR